MHIEMNKKKRRTTMSRGKASQIIAVDVAQHINIKLFYCLSSDSFFFLSQRQPHLPSRQQIFYALDVYLGQGVVFGAGAVMKMTPEPN